MDASHDDTARRRRDELLHVSARPLELDDLVLGHEVLELALAVVADDPRNERCELCRDSLFAQLRGSAALRGERYADELAAKRRGPAVAWPSSNDQLLAIARERCADLSSDRAPLELLAAEFLAWAERRRVVWSPRQLPTFWPNLHVIARNLTCCDNRLIDDAARVY